MAIWQAVRSAVSVGRVLPVIWPVEWRITTTPGGLYLVEAMAGAEEWRLEGLFYRLGDALAFGESLHSGPERLAPARPSVIRFPERYRVPTGEGWHGRTYRSAIADSPFSLDASAEDIVEDSGWLRTRADALDGLKRGEKMLLVGAAGVGKTVFLKDLARVLRRKGVANAVYRPGDPLPPGREVLLVDDARWLDQASMNALLALDRPMLVGLQTGFETQVGPLDRIGLPMLAIEDVARLVATRLRAAGRPAGMVEPEAVLELARRSGGVRRDLVVLAGAAVFLADLECSPRITRRHVDDAVSLGRGQPVPGLQHSVRDRDLAPAPIVRSNRIHIGRGVAVLAASAGLAFVLATSWTAHWIGQQAASAAVEPSSFRPTIPTAPRQTALAAAEPTVVSAPAATRSVAARQAPQLQAPTPPPTPVLQASQAPSAMPAEPPVEAAATAQADPAATAADTVEGSFDADVVVAGAGSTERRLEPSPAGNTDALPGLALARTEPDFGSALADTLGSFKGPVNNETLRLSGKLSLDVWRDSVSGTVRAKFHAWDGLLGTGQLQGTLSPDGHVVLTGQLLMGKNPFICNLSGIIHGDRFTGSAQFVRPWGGRVAYSTFSLFKT